MTATTFEPRWASAPGATILEALNARHLTLEDLADALGLSDPDTRRLLQGEILISERLAAGIAEVAGGTARFWLTRDEQYRESKRLLSAEELAQQMPFSDIAKWGWDSKGASWRQRAALTLDYFGVSSGDEWISEFASRIGDAHYRASPTIQSSEVSVAVWLRQAEIQAAAQPLLEWNPGEADAAVAKIREASRQADPDIFLPAVSQALASVGATLVVVKAPKGCAVSGAAFSLKSGQRVIAVSARYRSDDHLFFTILHELGHHLLHGSDLYLDEFEDSDPSATEQQADAFAADALVPGGVSALAGRAKGPTMRQVLLFAARVGVAPGVVVGQLQHEGVIERHQLNKLKRFYKWDGVTLRSGRS